MGMTMADCVDIEMMDELTRAVNSVATEIKYLGNGDAATKKGAVEGLAMTIREGFEELAAATRHPDTAEAINGLAEAVQEGLYGLSNAIYALTAAVEKNNGVPDSHPPRSANVA
jgi:hypothetical protein